MAVVNDHTVKAFDEDLNRLRGLISEMGGRAEQALLQAMTALNKGDLDLAAQVKAPGATWLDHRLIERGAGVADGGFGAEVRRAMDARTDHLVKEGLARRFGERTVFERGMLETLRKRELDAVGAKIAGETGLAYRLAGSGEKIAGVVRQRLALASGRFAMIDDGLGFQLVPWSPSLERQLGQHISGVSRGGGGVDWSFGRNRGLGI